MKRVLATLLLFAAFAGEAANGADLESRSVDCVEKIKKIANDSLSNSPDFATIRDASKWLKAHLPPAIRTNFVDAGRNVSRSLKDWETHEMIHGPFWNTQALSELLYGQFAPFNGAAGCKLSDELGAAREIVEDRLFLALLLSKNESLDSALAGNGVSDFHYAKRMLMYGTILDFAGIEWKDEQLAQVVKYRAPDLTQ